MMALDFTSSTRDADGAPALFSGNIASLGRVFSRVSEIRVTEADQDSATLQTIVYQMTQ
jgi:hypothetical protein